MRLEEEIKQKQFRNEYHKLGVNILFTSSLLKLKTQQLLKPFGLSPEQFNVLRILRGQHPDPATVNMIIDRMIDKNSNASRIVDKLVEKKLVTRKESCVDRRQVDVFINEEGLKMLNEIDMHPDVNFDSTMQWITKDEAQIVNDILDKMRGPWGTDE